MTFLPILAAAMMALKVFPSAEVTSLSPLGRPFFRESLRCESMGHNGHGWCLLEESSSHRALQISNGSACDCNGSRLLAMSLPWPVAVHAAACTSSEIPQTGRLQAHRGSRVQELAHTESSGDGGILNSSLCSCRHSMFRDQLFARPRSSQGRTLGSVSTRLDPPSRHPLDPPRS